MRETRCTSVSVTFNQAHSAISGNGKTVMITEAGNVDACFLARVQDRGPLGNLDVLPVDVDCDRREPWRGGVQRTCLALEGTTRGGAADCALQYPGLIHFPAEGLVAVRDSTPKLIRTAHGVHIRTRS